VAALETGLALHDLASDLTDVTVIAPNSDFHYRPMTVREPFAQGPARRYSLAPIVSDAGASLLCAVTIDPARMDEILHGIVQDVETGYIKRLAFVAPGRMAWPLPLYELALMTAGRAYDMNMGVAITLITPEDSPLAIFGQNVSGAVAELLGRSNVQTIHSAYAEVHEEGEVVINPGDRRLHVDRVIALPELYGPSVRGVPLGEHGFLRVDRYGRVPLYLTAKITGGHGFSSELIDTPSWSPPSKIAAKYLAPYLDALDRETTPT
jgi:sulfide:quinone oxidoreductase